MNKRRRKKLYKKITQIVDLMEKVKYRHIHIYSYSKRNVVEIGKIKVSKFTKKEQKEYIKIIERGEFINIYMAGIIDYQKLFVKLLYNK